MLVFVRVSVYKRGSDAASPCLYVQTHMAALQYKNCKMICFKCKMRSSVYIYLNSIGKHINI